MEKSNAVPSPNTPTERRTGVETDRVTEQRERPPELERLNVFIGRWMTEG